MYKLALAIISGVLFFSISIPSFADESVNVYSSRKEALVKPLLDRFTKKTGIKVNLITAKSAPLLRKLELEGSNTPADIFFTVDAGNLARAKKANLLQPVKSTILTNAIPKHLRDRENYWFGLTIRARAIFYNKKTIKSSKLSTYEQLSNPIWKNRICIRSSNNIYNQSLVASMISHFGVEKVQKWADGFVKNFARNPKGGDRDQIKAVVAGVCDIALANSYYYAGMLKGKDQAQKEIAKQVGIFWPNQDGRGTHINVSGGGVTKYAKNKQNAIALLEFMVNEKSQAWYAKVNGEYPVVRGAKVDKLLASWGDFLSDDLNLSDLGEYNSKAVIIMDKAGWK